MARSVQQLIAHWEKELAEHKAFPGDSDHKREMIELHTDTIEALELLAEVRMIHITRGGRNPDEKRYTMRDIEQLVSIGIALAEKHRQKKAGSAPTTEH